MKDYITHFLIKAHKIILKQDASEESLLFIKNLRYVVIGGFIASILSMAFQVLAGRFFGPVEYGKYILMNSISVFLGVPMLFGIDMAIVKYNSEKGDLERHKKIISTTLIVYFVLSLFFGLIFLWFSPLLSKLFSVSTIFFNLSVLLTFSLLLFTLSSAALQSLHKIREMSVVKVLQKLFILALFSFFIFIVNINSYINTVYSFILASFLVFIISFFYLRQYIGFNFDWFWAEKLLRFGGYGVISGVAGAISSNFDKIVINKFLTSTEIGIYGAYSAAFIVPIFFLFSMFNSVFYPTVSKHAYKINIFNKINKIIPLLFTVALFFIILSGFVVLKLYGKDYSFDLRLGILFGFLAILMCLAGVYGSMMGSVGTRGIRICTIAGIILIN